MTWVRNSVWIGFSVFALALSVPFHAAEPLVPPKVPEAQILVLGPDGHRSGAPIDGPLDLVAPPHPPVTRMVPNPTLTGLRWPHPADYADRTHMVNYEDLDTTAGIQDYACGTTTYDGHRGLDVSLPDFEEMERGYWILAVEDGTVLRTMDGNFDRRTSTGVDTPNYVDLLHADGTVSRYLHMKKHSVAVRPGEFVTRGQPLGFIGSSGFSTGPHLHLEFWDSQNFNTFYAAYNGACNANSSMWESQPAYLWDEPAELMDLGVTVEPPTYPGVLRGLPELDHYPSNANKIVHFWGTFSGIGPTDVVRIVMQPTTGVLWYDFTFSPQNEFSWAWFFWNLQLPGNNHIGEWRAQMYMNGVLQGEKNFHWGGSLAPPVADPQTVNVPAGTNYAGQMTGSDADSTDLRFRIVTEPTQGRVIQPVPDRPDFIYLPKGGAAVTDSFTFQILDEVNQTSNVATVTLQEPESHDSALRVVGDQDSLVVPFDASLGVSSGFTLQAWVRLNEVANGVQLIYDSLSDDLGSGIMMYAAANGKLVMQAPSTGSSAVSNAFFPRERWVHVAASFDGATVRLYIDGVEDLAVPWTAPATWAGVTEVWLGGSKYNAQEWAWGWSGELDEIRLYNTARSAAQIAQDRVDCAPYSAAADPSLVGWWRMDGNGDDSSSFGNHATRRGGVSFAAVTSDAPVCSAIDHDADGIADTVDNCRFHANASQLDSDADGVGDACDTCPSVTDSTNADDDRDGIGNVCDNCRTVGNTPQTNGDGDAYGDACDPFPANASAGLPADPLLQLDKGGSPAVSSLTWGADPGSYSYEVLRGDPADLVSGYYGDCVSADDPDPTDTAYTDSSAPAAGAVSFFLVRGLDVDGHPGPAGRDLGFRLCE